MALEPHAADEVTKFQRRIQASFDSLLFEASLRGMKDKHTLLRQRHFNFWLRGTG